NPATLRDRNGRQTEYPKEIDDQYQRFSSSITLDQMEGRIDAEHADLLRQWAFYEREKAISYFRGDALTFGVYEDLLKHNIAGVLSKLQNRQTAPEERGVGFPRRIGSLGRSNPGIISNAKPGSPSARDTIVRGPRGEILSVEGEVLPSDIVT